jgi:hypothetical protein
MQIGGEPLKTIVVERLELSAPILPPNLSRCGMPESAERNCCPGKQVRWGFCNSYLDSSSLQSFPKGN